MINILRTLPAPVSLSKKRFEGVHEALMEVFSQKCYLCELKNSTSVEIEHFLPVSLYPDSEYLWENLFLSCNHCNTTKSYFSDKNINIELLDSTNFKIVITDEIQFVSNVIPKERLEISAVKTTPSAQTINTVKLLNLIYNSQTSAKKFGAKGLSDRVTQEMKQFLDILHEYDYDSHDQEMQNYYEMKIRNALSIESPFTAFKIWYIKRNESLHKFLHLLPKFNYVQ